MRTPTLTHQTLNRFDLICICQLSEFRFAPRQRFHEQLPINARSEQNCEAKCAAPKQ